MKRRLVYCIWQYFLLAKLKSDLSNRNPVRLVRGHRRWVKNHLALYRKGVDFGTLQRNIGNTKSRPEAEMTEGEVESWYNCPLRSFHGDQEPTSLRALNTANDDAPQTTKHCHLQRFDSRYYCIS